ncbi:hypothetical protein MMT22_29675, partial [Escherichia coli]|nr:hypothetical protein [Escherichia coli]
AREERGGISFESEEAKFIFNAERRIERIEQTQRNDAHKLIEEGNDHSATFFFAARFALVAAAIFCVFADGFFAFLASFFAA